VQQCLRKIQYTYVASISSSNSKIVRKDSNRIREVVNSNKNSKLLHSVTRVRLVGKFLGKTAHVREIAIQYTLKENTLLASIKRIRLGMNALIKISQTIKKQKFKSKLFLKKKKLILLLLNNSSSINISLNVFIR
jgi:hypothetical protein